MSDISKKLIFLAILTVFTVPFWTFGEEQIDITNLPKPPATVSVSEKGDVKIKNAVVFYIVSNTVFARTNWDNAYIRWTIRTDGNTKVIKRFDGVATLADIKVGHILELEGKLASGSEAMDLKATFIKDLSLENEDGSFSGTVSNVNNDGRNFTLKTKYNKNISVNVSSDATIKKGNITILSSKIKNGDVVLRLTGLYHQPSETIQAKTLEIYQDRAVFAPRNFQGKLKSLSANTLPSVATVTIGSVNYTFNLNEKTQVLNNKKANTKLNRFVEGDTVRLYGSLKEGIDNTADAEIIRNLDL